VNRASSHPLLKAMDSPSSLIDRERDATRIKKFWCWVDCDLPKLHRFQRRRLPIQPSRCVI
jgi:hypothetical protein